MILWSIYNFCCSYLPSCVGERWREFHTLWFLCCWMNWILSLSWCWLPFLPCFSAYWNCLEFLVSSVFLGVQLLFCIFPIFCWLCRCSEEASTCLNGLCWYPRLCFLLLPQISILSVSSFFLACIQFLGNKNLELHPQRHLNVVEPTYTSLPENPQAIWMPRLLVKFEKIVSRNSVLLPSGKQRKQLWSHLSYILRHHGSQQPVGVHNCSESHCKIRFLSWP